MHVTLTDVQNGEPVYLTRSLLGGLEVALCNLTYYHQWYNISAALKNNQVSNGHTTTVPDGYYNVCELSEEVFQPFEPNLICMRQLVAKSCLRRNVWSNIAGWLNSLGFLETDSNPAKRTSQASQTDMLSIGRSVCTSLR